MFFWGLLFIAAGITYLIKPDIFQRWIWRRTAISQRLLTPQQNKVYMRILGAVFIVVGIGLIATERIAQAVFLMAIPFAVSWVTLWTITRNRPTQL